MSGLRPRAAARWGGWVLAAALGVALYSHAGALDRANDRLSHVRPLAERTSVRDRLIGTDASGLRFRRPGGERAAAASGTGRSVLWLVDPDECANCLVALAEWRELARGGLSMTTVLVNVSPVEAERIRRSVDLPGEVALDPDGEEAASLGLSAELPSLYLVLDSAGTVVMTEGRRSATSCDWSFSGQVAALIGSSRGAVRRANAGP